MVNVKELFQRKMFSSLPIKDVYILDKDTSGKEIDVMLEKIRSASTSHNSINIQKVITSHLNIPKPVYIVEDTECHYFHIPKPSTECFGEYVTATIQPQCIQYRISNFVSTDGDEWIEHTGKLLATEINEYFSQLLNGFRFVVFVRPIKTEVSKEENGDLIVRCSYKFGAVN